MRPPTREQVARYADQLRLDLPDSSLDGYRALAADCLDSLAAIETLPVPAVPLRHPHRDPGRPPLPDEDPCRAVVRFCDVRGVDTGPLTGLRVGVKDCIAVAGVPMTNGGDRHPVPVPTEDALVVERLLDAGARIVAKTNLPDQSLGLGSGSAFGAVRNPHDPRFSAGGSSSGSGAAVATGLVDAALGADQGGSVRIPAAWCGIVGLKPTHGLVPTHGLLHLDHSVDHVGPMTTTVAANAEMLDVLVGADWRDSAVHDRPHPPGHYLTARDQGVEELRVGIVADALEPAGCSTAVLDAFDRARRQLTDLGAKTVEVSVPHWLDASVVTRVITSRAMLTTAFLHGQSPSDLAHVDADVLAALGAQQRDASSRLPDALLARLLTAAHLRDAYQGVPFGAAQNLRLWLRRHLDDLFTDVDLLITPTTPTGPVRLPTGQPDDADRSADRGLTAVRNTIVVNLTGHPALTVPSDPGDDALPTGLQIIGRRLDEHTVYRAGFAYEAAREPLSGLRG